MLRRLRRDSMENHAPPPIPPPGQIRVPWVEYRTPGCRGSHGWWQMVAPLGSIARKVTVYATLSDSLQPTCKSWSSVLHYSAPLDLVTRGERPAQSEANIPSAAEIPGSTYC